MSMISRADCIKETPRFQEARRPVMQHWQRIMRSGYLKWRRERPLLPLKASYPFHMGSPALDLALQPVFTAIRSHYENAKFLGVDADPNSSGIQKFFGLNAQEKRYKDFPQAKFAPSSITLSEDGWCHLLYGNTASENILKIVMKPHEAEVKKLPTTRKNISGGPFIDQYVAFMQHKTGILVRTLFGTGVHQGVLLISDEHNKDSRVLRPVFHTDGLTITLLAHNLAMPKKKKKSDDGGGGGGGGGDDPRGGDIKGKGVKRDVEGRGDPQRPQWTRRAAALRSSAGGSDVEAHFPELQSAIKASKATFQQERDILMQEGEGGANSPFGQHCTLIHSHSILQFSVSLPFPLTFTLVSFVTIILSYHAVCNEQFSQE